MKVNSALAVFLLLAEPGSPFHIGSPATSPILKRSRTLLSASTAESGLVSAYAKFTKYKKVKASPAEIDVNVDAPAPDVTAIAVPDAPVEIITPPGASHGSLGIHDHVPVPDVAAPKASMVDEFIDAARENYHTARTSIVDSPQSPGEVPTLGEYFRNNAGAMKGSVESTATTTYVPEGKAPTLFQFLQEQVTHTGAMVHTGAEHVHIDALGNVKAKLGVMLGNAADLLGKKPLMPSMSRFSGMDLTLPAMAGPPEGSAGWVVAGFAFLVAAGQRRAGLADAKAEMQDMIMKEASAMGELSGDMKSMAEEIKQLTAATGDLRKELNESKKKLAQKEFQISKEQLKSMEKEAKLTKEIQKMQAQLKEGDHKVVLLIQELEQTIQVREQLVKAMDTVKVLEAELRKARGEPEPEPEPETQPSVTIIEPDISAILEERATLGNAEAPAKKEVKGEKQPVDEAKGVVKKTAAKKATKKTVHVVKDSTAKAEKEPEPFFLNDTEPKEEKPAPKASKKPAKEAEAAPGRFRSLSKSALSRKTVKELTEFLKAEGVVTTGDDGKPLKKAVLVESVQSL